MKDMIRRNVADALTSAHRLAEITLQTYGRRGDDLKPTLDWQKLQMAERFARETQAVLQIHLTGALDRIDKLLEEERKAKR